MDQIVGTLPIVGALVQGVVSILTAKATFRDLDASAVFMVMTVFAGVAVAGGVMLVQA